MEKRLQIYVNKDGSVEFKTALPTIYQYEDYVVYFDFEFESQPADEASVQIMFRRSDGKTSAYLPLVTTNYQNKLYSIKLDNPWFWYKPGLLTFKVNTLTPSGEKNYSTFSSDYASIDIIAVPDTTFMAPPMAPSAYELVLMKLENTLTLDEFNEAISNKKLVTDLIAGNVSDNGYKTTVFYSNTGGEVKQVDINLPTNNVTNEELTTTISDMVAFESVSTYDGSVPAVELAKKAEEDSEGNRIIDTYANKNEINTFSQPQIFTERVDIKNEDGTVDSIKHINNNFLISASSGENLLNLDEQLNKGYVFNEEIALNKNLLLASESLQNDIKEIRNKPVYALVYVYGFPFGANCLIGQENNCLVVDDDTGHAYACGIFISRNDEELNPILRYFVPIGNAPVVENPQLEILSVIKVGDL